LSSFFGGVIRCLNPRGFDPGPARPIPSEFNTQLQVSLFENQLISDVDAHPPIELIKFI
jgi:hypothetical protein